MPDPGSLTEQQQKWFASVREGLERETGRSLAQWADATARAIHDAVREAAMALPGTILGQRKGFTAFSRNWQFAAIKPAKRGVVLRLAVDRAFDAALLQAGREGWSERLLSRTGLDTPADVTPRVAALLREAWERS